jgi:putative tricarboxylic transport membrane protein
MLVGIRNNRDVWAGLMLIGIGAASIWLARDYAFGTSLRMGPGYFPTILGGVLVVFGLILLGRGLRVKEEIEGGWSIRALLIVPLSLVLFGALIDSAGFVPALAALIFASAAASREFQLREVALLAIGLMVFSIGVFVWALGLPYRLLVGF